VSAAGPSPFCGELSIAITNSLTMIIHDAGSPLGSVDGDGTGRFGEVDPALRSRDVRTEPLKQFAKWASFLGSSDSD